jgi:proteasome beta subunit
MDMVKLFQLQLEHYEKVEGSALSLEGKANQLSAMVRNNLPAAMQGLAVVPLFAGSTWLGERAAVPVRRHRRPLRGEQLRLTGSGSMHASTVIKLGFREGMSREDTLDLAINALFTAPTTTRPPAGPRHRPGGSTRHGHHHLAGFERVPDIEWPSASPP